MMSYHEGARVYVYCIIMLTLLYITVDSTKMALRRKAELHCGGGIL